MKIRKLFMLTSKNIKSTFIWVCRLFGKSKWTKINVVESLPDQVKILKIIEIRNPLTLQCQTMQTTLIWVCRIGRSKIAKFDKLETLANKRKISGTIKDKKLFVLYFQENEINSPMGV